MGMFDEVLCNHELFGVHKGETHQTKDLHCLDGALKKYEITASGRLEFLEYTVEDRSDPTLEGIERFCGMMTPVFTGGRRDLNYHGWLYLSCFGRAKFTEGSLVAFEPEPDQPTESEHCEEALRAAEESGALEDDPVTMELKHRRDLAVIAKRFRGEDLPSWDDLEAFVDLMSPLMRSKLSWRLNKSLGLDANAICQLLEDKSIGDAVAQDWRRFERESGQA